ncbi:MAG: molybdenum cofactor biosynthesis protein MoaE [Flavobacteriaceae bacterium]|nr:molybdenum cofactor biosynthesis protein MoaE [Flavobacteriaceae bacterium]
MTENSSVKITTSRLNLQECYDFVEDTSCGGIALFVGTVRNQTQDKEVTLLDFSSYEAMALKEMQKIADKALNDFDILKIAIHHAEGKLTIGAIPVIIAVSAPHRKAAFEACQFAIDTLKETVPIWKKEHFVDGEVWVNATP